MQPARNIGKILMLIYISLNIRQWAGNKNRLRSSVMLWFPTQLYTYSTLKQEIKTPEQRAACALYSERSCSHKVQLQNFYRMCFQQDIKLRSP